MSDKTTHQPFASQHATGRERYLTQVMEYVLAEGWAKPEDFIRHFPPAKMIRALANQDELRVELLVKAGRVHERIAAKKSIDSAAEDFEIAMAEELCVPSDVLELFKPDDRVNYLDAPEIWKFATEGEFYSVGAIDPDYERVLARLVFMVNQALDQNLISLQDVGDALTFAEIASLMPVERLQDVVRHALKEGRAGNPITEQSLLTVVSMSELLGYFNLEQVWKRLIIAKIAGPQGYVSDSEAPKNGPTPAAPKSIPKPSAVKPSSTTSVSTISKPAVASTLKPATPAPKATPAAKPPTESKPQPDSPPNYDEEELPSETEDVSPADLDMEPDPDDPQAQAMARLKEIERLPPNADALPLPVLLSIESMYAELEYAETDEESEELIRESFPNEAHLRTAMLALIELLDPSIDTKDSLIKDAEIDSLIKIVMFEERRRR